MEWYSDASLSSSDESDDEEDPPEIFCQRELDYWQLEELMEISPPPPVLDYLNKNGSFCVRECIFSELGDIRDVVDPISANNWEAFWTGGYENKDARFVFEDFDAICEYSLYLCGGILHDVSNERLHACAIAMLSHGKFI